MSSRRSFFLGGTASFLVTGMASQIGSASPAETPGWQAASPESQGISASILEAALASGSSVSALRSLLVVRNGVLVGERYYGGATSTDLLAVNSATKSVCSMLVGKALQQGKLKALSQSVGELLPDFVQKSSSSSASSVTLRQILTGTTNISYEFTTQLRALVTAPDPAPRANMTCCISLREISEQRGPYDEQPATQGPNAFSQIFNSARRIARRP